MKIDAIAMLAAVYRDKKDCLINVQTENIRHIVTGQGSVCKVYVQLSDK